jgi:hypothetical protein
MIMLVLMQIIRNTSGIPEVLTRLDASPSSPGEPSVEYES